MLYSRSRFFFESSGKIFDHLGVDSTRVDRFSSFQLVSGVVEFLHREWFHCVLVLFTLVLVFVFVFVFLRRGRAETLV